jgi:hypothetical protein
MTPEEKENWESVHYRIREEGFDYCFRNYSRFPEIKDDYFHAIRQQYIETASELERYINEKYKESQDE